LIPPNAQGLESPPIPKDPRGYPHIVRALRAGSGARLSGSAKRLATTSTVPCHWLLPGGATCGTLMLTLAFGVMPMPNVLWLLPRPNRSSETAKVPTAPSDHSGRVRAGEIGPIRREIIFEPVHEQPAPVEPAPVTPETDPKEPVPDRT
jgi:hypothetical protein